MASRTEWVKKINKIEVQKHLFGINGLRKLSHTNP